MNALLDEFMNNENQQYCEAMKLIKEKLFEIPPQYTIEIDHRTKFIDIAKAMACVLVESHQNNSGSFLSIDQLYNLAKKQNSAELDIDKNSGVYVFLSLRQEVFIKVGQSKDIRCRFVNGHFDSSQKDNRSNLVNYYEYNWPNSIEDDEVVAVIFPMYGTEECDRLTVEKGLKNYLNPLIKW